MEGQQRRTWSEERDRRALVPNRDDFAKTGLMAHLDEPRLLVTTLPTEPLRPMLEFDDSLAGVVLPQSFSGRTGQTVSLLTRLASTSSTLVRYSDNNSPGSPWRAFAAVRRDGGVDIGFGSTVRRVHGAGSPLAGMATYALYIVTHAVRAAIDMQSRLLTRVPPDEILPIEIDVALPGVGGAVLDGFADGWANAADFYPQLSACLDSDALVRVEVENWPAGEQKLDLVVQVAQRVCEAFSVMEPRFLVRFGQPRAGLLLPEYA